MIDRPNQLRNETPPAEGVPQRTIFKLVVLLILVGGLAYCDSFTKPFQYDDVLWISKNGKIGELSEYLQEMPSRKLITLLMHMHYRLHGLNVFGYHLGNLTIHVAAALCLFGVVRRTLLLPKWQGRFAGNAHWFAFAIALLWMVHPLQTQAVTYIIQRCESLMGLFFLLSLYCLIRASQAASKWGWYLLSWLSCVAGSHCKEVMVTVLPVMLCYDYVFLGTMRDLLKRRAWFYAAVASIWVMPVFYGLVNLSNADSASSAGFSLAGLPPHVYMMTQTGMLLHYIRMIFVPYPQSFSYRGWPLTTEFADCWPAALAVGILALLSAWLLLRRHWVGFAGAWFFGILSITSIVPLLDVGCEYRLYLPLAAFCALAVFGTYFFLQKAFHGRALIVVSAACLIGVSTILTAMTLMRNEDYRSTTSLWQSVHRIFPNEHEALTYVAAGLLNEGKLEDAKAFYKKSLEASPGDFLADFGYGLVLCQQDEYAQGLPHMLAGLKLIERDANLDLWTYQCNHQVGLAYWAWGDLSEAERSQRKAIRISPKKAAAYGALTAILVEQNRLEEAKQAHAQAMQADPNYVKTSARIADSYLHQGDLKSKWVRKEALMYASIAAFATEYKNPAYGAILAEAYAANQMYPQAIQAVRDSLRTIDGSTDPQLRPQLERALIQYEQQQKKFTEKKDKH